MKKKVIYIVLLMTYGVRKCEGNETKNLLHNRKAYVCSDVILSIYK